MLTSRYRYDGRVLCLLRPPPPIILLSNFRVALIVWYLFVYTCVCFLLMIRLVMLPDKNNLFGIGVFSFVLYRFHSITIKSVITETQ